MKLIHYFLAFLLITGFMACGNNTSEAKKTENVEGNNAILAEEEDALWDDVMELHDDVMPKMTAMNRLGKQLKEAIEAEKILEADTASVNKVIASLASADKGMWDWMHNLQQLDRLRQSKNHKEIMEYLEGEKVAVTKVRLDMLNSIEAGENLIKKFELSEE